MIERHTFEFNRFGVNVLSDAERAAISLQFDTSGYGVEAIEPILKAVKRRFGRGIWGQLSRWMTGEGDLLLLISHGKPHPDNPDVIRVEMAIKDGERMDSALAALVDFFRRQPGFCRMLGSPLDRDDLDRRTRGGMGDVSRIANETFRRMWERWARKEAGR
jgi:hypothetical protein